MSFSTVTPLRDVQAFEALTQEIPQLQPDQPVNRYALRFSNYVRHMYYVLGYQCEATHLVNNYVACSIYF